MKRLLRWVTYLYPRAWHDRYGAEFQALLDESNPRAGDVWDIAKEALKLHMRNAAVLAAMCAVLGAIAGSIIWSQRPHYALGAVMAISVSDGDTVAARQAVDRLAQAIITPDFLGQTITRLGLYQSEGQPPEKLIRRFREDIQIAPLAANVPVFDFAGRDRRSQAVSGAASGNDQPVLVQSVRVRGSSPHLAAAIRQAVVARLIDVNRQIGGPYKVQLIGMLPPDFEPPPMNRSLIVPLWAAAGALLGLGLASLGRAIRPRAA